ncbi:MAG: hydroxysqualene dehydroxylase HpnE [Melioribacteraceae bacterium]
MAKCIIIGGGIAGLSTAVYLSKYGHEIELIESSPKFGGRTYSFFSNTFDAEIDNGQHLLMGAYKNTIDFLKITNAIDKIEFQENIKVIYINKLGEKFKIDASKYFYPINLLSAIWNFNVLNKKEKLFIIKFIISLFIQDKNKLENITVAEWLKKNNQSINTIKSFWKILTVSALNTNIDEAYAYLFKKMLVKIFFAGNKSSIILIPKENLSKIFVEPTLEFLQRKNFSYSVSEKLEYIKIDKNFVKEIRTNKRTLTQFDYLILAITPYQIKKIICNENLIDNNFDKFETSAIISVNLKLKKNFMTEKFVALIDSKIHWIFNHGEFITIVISDANRYVEFPQDIIVEICISELQKYFKEFKKEFVFESSVIKEKRATIKSTPNFEKIRSKVNSKISNLQFAGDWTNTGFPQTIESAIYSGLKAAKKICS